jgi:hypothetical protein
MFIENVVSFEVFTAEIAKIVVFWDAAMCSLVDGYRNVGGICCFYLHY